MDILDLKKGMIATPEQRAILNDHTPKGQITANENLRGESVRITKSTRPFAFFLWAKKLGYTFEEPQYMLTLNKDYTDISQYGPHEIIGFYETIQEAADFAELCGHIIVRVPLGEEKYLTVVKRERQPEFVYDETKIRYVEFIPPSKTKPEAGHNGAGRRATPTRNRNTDDFSPMGRSTSKNQKSSDIISYSTDDMDL